jgi:hypothetical protein
MAKKKMSAAEAKEYAKGYGWNFSKDFHEQSTSSMSAELTALAKLVGYKKPASGSGSTARYFFAYLQKK